MDAQWRLFILAGVYVAAIAAADVAASLKLAAFNLLGLTFVLPAGTVAFSLIFPILNGVNEVYGRRVAYNYVLAGLAGEVTLASMMWLALASPPLEPGMQEALAAVAAKTTRIVVASITAYMVSTSSDVWLFWLWRLLTRGRMLWLRANASTIISQLVDSTVFTLVAFLGVRPGEELVNMIVTMWLFKLLVAVASTPLVYAIAWWLRQPARPAGRQAKPATLEPSGAPKAGPLNSPAGGSGAPSRG